MNEQHPEEKSLVTKLCEVVAATERVPKNGWNDFHKYAFARESDIVETIRGELSQRNIFISPNIVEHHRTPKEGDKGGYLTDILVEWTFRDGDSGESFSIRIPGCGEDKGDKGFYKAFTGSEKYMLTKSFLIPTGDDPENEDAKAPGPPQQGREYKLNPSPQKPPTNEPGPENGESHQVGRVMGVSTSSDGKAWYVNILGNTFSSVKNSGNSVWTHDQSMATALLKEQGTVIRAHLRSKRPGSYQLVSYIPEGDQT